MDRATPPDAAAGQAPLSASLLAQVWLPFALGNAVSYLYRTINASIAPYLSADLGLTAAELGFLTSTYFLGFALTQLPAGVLLDRFGPRLVQAGLLMVAVGGAVLFALAEGWTGVVAGRFLIGAGVSVSLMAGFKAAVDWFPPNRLALLNALTFAAGGLGNIAATVPALAFVAAHGWRTAHLGMAALTVAVAAIVWFTVPERAVLRQAENPGAEAWRGVAAVFRSAAFWRFAPHSILVHGGGFVAVQGLWLGPWLHDVLRLDPAGVTGHLLVGAVAVVGGYLLMGTLAGRAERLGIDGRALAALVSAAFMAVETAMAFAGPGFALAALLLYGLTAPNGTLHYATLSRLFPREMAGRVNTALNLAVFTGAFLMQWLLGVLIDLWPRDALGHYPAEAYRAMFLTLVALQLPATVWLALGRRG
ncbi:MFS transporter [Azospirillum sp. RWY-5-1]|uniref:MFS transporter n=1 Tax=Azospirillum oleiclasticum TaxID=2735135 RepID=A0ABX2T5V1_9PROT|nr:MFS transporter [Azospirillum oleiclasticum]NYZ12550.1 MFS transporter [Azospirillum oleiclasticum]NYZ19710.1 MFS transporter [Azospirillum oleiclasticum]